MKLFSEFPRISKEEWLAKVEKDLKGKPREALNRELAGFTLSPFFHGDDLKEKYAPLSDGREDNTWEIGEVILVKGEDYKTANTQALSALMRGANALCFEVNETPTLEEMRVLTKEIQHEWISTHFVSQSQSWQRLSENFKKILEEKGQDPAKVSCSFQWRGDSLKALAIADELPQAEFLTIDTRKEYPEAAEELADALLQYHSILSSLNDQGKSLSSSNPKIRFSLSVSDDYFVAVAKLRALKNTTQVIADAWKIEADALPMFEVHLTEQYQSEDENYNKIKATTQALSAVIGGAKRLFVYPSDQFKNPGGDNFSGRIALNVQHLLQQESYLHRVNDPAAGSYFIEELTDMIGEKAWNIFREKSD